MKEKIVNNFIKSSQLQPESKETLLASLFNKSLDKGQIITGGSSVCEGIPIVLSGVLRLFRISEMGKELTIYRVNKGEVCLLAALCTLGTVEYDYIIEAETDSELAIIPNEIFKKLINSDQKFRNYLFNLFGLKLISSLETIEMLNFTSIEERLMDYLLRHSKNNVVTSTHEKLAVELGSTREVISRTLKKMSNKDIITQKRGVITLN